MFITSKYSGYNRHGEQCAAGYFLILMQPKWESTQYPHYETACKVCGKSKEEHQTSIPYVPACQKHGIVARLRARHDRTEAELDAICNAGERFVSDCSACDASKAYQSLCHTFTPASINYPIRALVRYTRMRQLGHFMMGFARVNGQRITLSGSYGSDGLPSSVPDETYAQGIELPTELYSAWNTGGGWNDVGSEAPAMREWAKKTFPRPKK
jgi:hypothetical protein